MFGVLFGQLLSKLMPILVGALGMFAANRAGRNAAQKEAETAALEETLAAERVAREIEDTETDYANEALTARDTARPVLAGELSDDDYFRTFGRRRDYSIGNGEDQD